MEALSKPNGFKVAKGCSCYQFIYLRLPIGPDMADLLGGGPPLRTGGPLFIGGGPLDDIPLKKESPFPES